jgi:hypothetical protein
LTGRRVKESGKRTSRYKGNLIKEIKEKLKCINQELPVLVSLTVYQAYFCIADILVRLLQKKKAVQRQVLPEMDIPFSYGKKIF